MSESSALPETPESSAQIPLFNRESGQIEYEQVFERALMDFFYGHPVGRLIEAQILSRPSFSKLLRWLNRNRGRAEIDRFIQTYGVDVNEILEPLAHFRDFSEFFIRELKPDARPLPSDPERLISPADARLLALPLDGARLMPVKGAHYTLLQLLENRALAEQFHNGWVLVYRLAPVDYHRYCYIDDGEQTAHVSLPGRLHSVNPLSLWTGLPVFARNYRQYTLLKTVHFGPVIHMEVGALMVGRIFQHDSGPRPFERGQEKGYFELGGSTIVQIFEADRIALDDDILKASADNIETRVKYRMPVGRRL